MAEWGKFGALEQSRIGKKIEQNSDTPNCHRNRKAGAEGTNI